MCVDPVTLSLIATGIGTATSFIGSMQQAKYSEKLAAQNAAMSERAAEDAVQRGSREEALRRLQTAQDVGSAAANLAGSGFVVGQGSALTKQSDLQAMGDLEALTIRNNAAREAYNIKVQGVQAQNKLYGDAAEAKNKGFSSLISGATSMGATAYGAGLFSKTAAKPTAQQLSGPF